MMDPYLDAIMLFIILSVVLIVIGLFAVEASNKRTEDYYDELEDSDEDEE